MAYLGKYFCLSTELISLTYCILTLAVECCFFLAREFLSELLKTAFDPARGFFMVTGEGFLYPNPVAPLLFPDNYHRHFVFLGRMLGKVR